MNKRLILTAGMILAALTGAFAQPANSLLKTYRVGIFSPLYLDSVFSGSGYKYGKNFPRFTQQGLDFVQGAQIALDSFAFPKNHIRASIYDSKAETENIGWLIRNHKLDSLDLLIGATKDAEFLQLAAFAKQQNIPFISAIYPNDGGITANPFLVIVNSTLKAHCESIYSYLLQSHGPDKIYLCRKKGIQEDKIAEYFKAINEPDGKPLLNIQTVSLEEDFSILKNKLDSNRKSVLIGGSLSEDFAAELMNAAYTLKKSYPMECIGMPNWDGFAEIRKPVYKDFPVLFTTAYINDKTDLNSRRIQNIYAKKYKGVPSDMSYKGFETVSFFTKLIGLYPNDFMSHLNESGQRIFNEFHFRPVFLNKNAGAPDYFENKHLYFMKLLNGKILRVW
ncbi:MAG: ABC transporter substrate-binding protein [Ferruginibacter sp.]